MDIKEKIKTDVFSINLIEDAKQHLYNVHINQPFTRMLNI